MMQLLWSPRSPFVRQVMIAAHEKGLTGRIRLVPVTVTMTSANPAALAVNPLGRIPALTLEDGRVLPDSRVIIDHLDRIGSGALLLPAEDAALLGARRLQALANGVLELSVLWRNARSPGHPLESAALAGALHSKVAATLELLESEAPAIAAAEFSAGQIALGAALGYLAFRFADLDLCRDRPGLNALAASLEARPSFAASPLSEG